MQIIELKLLISQNITDKWKIDHRIKMRYINTIKSWKKVWNLIADFHDVLFLSHVLYILYILIR